jgi:hypothetical protein
VRCNQVARKSLHPYKIGTPKVFEWFTIYISELVFDLQPHLHSRSPGLQSDSVSPLVSPYKNGYSLLAMLATHILRKRVSSCWDLAKFVYLSYVLPGQGMNASMNDSHNLGQPLPILTSVESLTRSSV